MLRNGVTSPEPKQTTGGNAFKTGWRERFSASSKERASGNGSKEDAKRLLTARNRQKGGVRLELGGKQPDYTRGGGVVSGRKTTKDLGQ